MLSVPVPVTLLPGENINSLGIIQYSRGKHAERLDERTGRLIEHWSRIF